jgi:hypothetical protein
MALARDLVFSDRLTSKEEIFTYLTYYSIVSLLVRDYYGVN